jgi:hypothetical protein
MTIFDLGLADGISKTAASGPHVDAAVRELRARGHDRLAAALLKSSREIIGRKKPVVEIMGLARMASAPGTPPVVVKGLAQALSDKPWIWDGVVAMAKRDNPARQRELAGYASSLVQGTPFKASVVTRRPSAAVVDKITDAVKTPAPSATGKVTAIAKSGISGKAKLGLAAALALAGYGAYQALTPKRYDNDRV